MIWVVPRSSIPSIRPRRELMSPMTSPIYSSGTTTSTDITCTNSGTAAGLNNTATGANQNATTTNAGTNTGLTFSRTTNGGNATAINSGSNAGLAAETDFGGTATATNFSL